MEVYSPSSDNLYENRSDFTSTLVNKRRNYENLQRSIQAHKNRLAMARMKKGKNLPSDELSKYEGSGCCRQSTADTNEGFEQYRFRRHTQSSLNKVTKPVSKYNNLSAANSFDGKYDNEQLYIRKYDDFQAKMNQSLARCHTRLQPKLSNKSDFSFDDNFNVNKVSVPEDELEKKIVEVLGKLLLKKELKPSPGVLSQQTQLEVPKMFQDGTHDKVVDILTKCISTTLNTAANDSLDNLSSARTSKSVNVEINLNMPCTKESEPVVTVNMQDDVEESSVLIENVFDKDTKVVKDNVFKDFFGKFKKLCSSEKKDKQVLNDRKERLQLKSFNEKMQNKDFQVNKFSKVPGEVQPDYVNVEGVGAFKNNQVDLEEQKLWSVRGNTQMTRKNSFVGSVFRPFSRSRSQSVHVQQKVGSVKPQVLPKNTNYQQNFGGNVVRRNSGMVPVYNGGFCAGMNVMQPQVMQQQKQVQKVGSFNEQGSPLGVDYSFNPFNLPQPYFNPQTHQEQNQVFGKQVFNGQQVVMQGQDFAKTPVVQRNNRFVSFVKRSVTRSVVGGFPNEMNQRFERNGFGCFDLVGKARQNTKPMLQRTYNVNKKGLLEPRVLTGQFQQFEQGKVLKQPQTPMGFTVVKRINTEPKNFNGLQVQSPSFMSSKQLTGDVKMEVNQPVTKTKLLKTTSVIDTLNQLSKINSMY